MTINVETRPHTILESLTYIDCRGFASFRGWDPPRAIAVDSAQLAEGAPEGALKDQIGISALQSKGTFHLKVGSDHPGYTHVLVQMGEPGISQNHLTQGQAPRTAFLQPGAAMCGQGYLHNSNCIVSVGQGSWFNVCRSLFYYLLKCAGFEWS